MTINPWNILSVNGVSSSNGSAQMSYNQAKNCYSYTQNLSNITQVNAGGWVHGYPSLIMGKSPHSAALQTNGYISLPKQVSLIQSMNFNVNYAVNNTPGEPLNFMSEGWILKDPNRTSGGAGVGEIEFMVMLFRDSTGPAGTKMGTFSANITVNGVSKTETFDVYKALSPWTFITFVPRTNYKNGDITMNLKDFFPEIAKQAGFAIDNLFFVDYEVGSEYGSPTINHSKFDWSINNFSLTVQ